MKTVLNKPSILATVMTVICLIIQSKISLYCSGIDGYLISMVSNGCYSENNYCMFIHPLLFYVCGKLSYILPYAVFRKNGTFHYYIFSRGGFTQELIMVAEKGEVTLLTLEDLYTG